LSVLGAPADGGTGAQGDRCRDALAGNALWHNPLKGFGRGLATIATEDNPGSSNAAVPSEQNRREAAAAAASA